MNRTITSAAIGAGVLGGALVGASFVGPAGAYGDDGETPAPADTEIGTEQSADDQAESNVQIQDAETPEAEGDEREGRRGRRGGCGLEAAAEAIGITEDELRTELDAGQSIADVAEANGVSADVVVDALVDAAEERIEQKLEAGRITEDEAAEKLADAEARAEDKVERVRGEETTETAA